MMLLNYVVILLKGVAYSTYRPTPSYIKVHILEYTIIIVIKCMSLRQ